MYRAGSNANDGRKAYSSFYELRAGREGAITRVLADWGKGAEKILTTEKM
jgi:hypothetical protein